MKRAPRSRQRHDLYAKYHDYDSEISDLLGECGDRILGAKNVKRVLEDAESGQLERLRQSCLYLDVIGGKTILPEDVITKAKARFMTVLAGELWAEMLGHFPWEFDTMIRKVSAYEIRVGFPEDAA